MYIQVTQINHNQAITNAAKGTWIHTQPKIAIRSRSETQSNHDTSSKVTNS